MKLITVLSGALLGVVATSATEASIGQHQQPLQAPDQFDLIKELRKAEIIPTVLDPFQPFLSVNISWKKANADIGNTIKPKKVKKTPKVHLLDNLPDLHLLREHGHDDHLPQLTLVLTDPDARSRDDPDWSEMCHWIATNVTLRAAEQDSETSRSHGFTEIVPYKAPAPPKKTGKHRYVFAALAPKNGTLEPLHLTTPKTRKHWGYGTPRTGLRQWAEENGLVVVGANFIYAQHKKQ